MEKTIIELEGKKYEVDLVKARQQGLIKEVKPRITTFRVGDVYALYQGKYTKIVILPRCWSDATQTEKYFITGLDGDGLDAYSDFGEQGATKEEIVKFLNTGEKVYLGNISKGINNLIAEL